MKQGNEMRMKMMIARAKRSALGRTLCRLAGDRSGGIMMEYVIIGVLVAAAVVVAVTYFGDTIREQFTAMGHAASGETKLATDANTRAKGNAAAAESDGKSYADGFSDKKGKGNGN